MCSVSFVTQNSVSQQECDEVTNFSSLVVQLRYHFLLLSDGSMERSGGEAGMTA